MLKKITSFFIALVFIFYLSPVFLFAQAPSEGSGLVPCGVEKYPEGYIENGKDLGGQIITPCEFNDFMKLINNVVSFVLFQLAVPIAAIMFAYAGGLLLFSGGEVSKRTEAKKIFTNVAIGLIIAAAAWLIINTILSILGYDGSWIGF